MNPITRALFKASDLKSLPFWHTHIFLPEDNDGLKLRKVMLVVIAICLFDRPMTDFPDEIKTKIFDSDSAFQDHYKRFWEAKLILDKPLDSISREELQTHSLTMDTIWKVQLKNEFRFDESNDFVREGNFSGITSYEIFVFLGEAAHFLSLGSRQRKPIKIYDIHYHLYLFAALNRQTQMIPILAAKGIQYKTNEHHYKFECLHIAAHFDDYDFIDAFLSIQKEILAEDFSDFLDFAIKKTLQEKSKLLEKIVQYGRPEHFNMVLDFSQHLPLAEVSKKCTDLKQVLDYTRLLIKSGAKPELLFSTLVGQEFTGFDAEVYITLGVETSNSADLSYNFITLLLQVVDDELDMTHMTEAIQILRETCELYSAILNANFEKANNLLKTHSQLYVNLSVNNSPNLAHYILATRTEITPVIVEILTLLIEKHYTNVMIENSHGQLLHEIAGVHPNGQVKKLLFNHKIDLFQTIFHDCNGGLIDKLLNANYQLTEVVVAEYRMGKEHFQIELNSRQFFILFAHELVMLRNFIKADKVFLPKRFYKVVESIAINDPIENVTHALYGQFTRGEQANLEKYLVNLQRLNVLLAFHETKSFTKAQQASIPVVSSEVAPTMGLRITEQKRITEFFKINNRKQSSEDDDDNITQYKSIK